MEGMEKGNGAFQQGDFTPVRTNKLVSRGTGPCEKLASHGGRAGQAWASLTRGRPRTKAVQTTMAHSPLSIDDVEGGGHEGAVQADDVTLQVDGRAGTGKHSD